MAKTALTQLQDQIEAIRQEAYDAGFAAAMQAVRDFAARPAAAPARAPRTAAPPPVKPAARRGRPPKAVAAARPVSGSARRPHRGTNSRLVAEVLKGLPSGTGRPADIRRSLQNDKGVAMAFTSIRHALGQLAQRNEAEASGDGKTWRYTGE
jgi:hypothetical protein